jgi:AcrR family transcriptional regulator
MPRHVDHDHRRQEIIDATLEVLAEHGPSGLSFRTIARHMGGSSTLVTHYFRTRQELLDTFVESITGWPDEIAELEAGADDPRERLRLFLRWLVPEDDRGLKEESARINLIGERDTRLRTDHIFAAWDTKVRELIAHHLRGLVPAKRVPAIVDVLRSATNGVTLSVVEHPSEWPIERQHAVVDEILEALDLAPRQAKTRSKPKIAAGSDGGRKR